MIGRTISHYKILEKLGGGGMGVVYKAEDTKLKRTVALKFLPPELTRDEDAKERFIQEAQSASALDHPNICNIHEIDETADGQMFICMAYYEGETLKQKIARGPAAIERAIDTAIQISEGLAKAHRQGIVHRDVKPANLMLTNDGAVKIVDFGLAKLVGGARVTKTGTTVGTVAYMSPEQARGEAVDHRTDIWSLGVVLYEMITGQLPFKSDYEQAVIYSILHEPAPRLSEVLKNVSAPLSDTVAKTLEKDRDERFPSMEEVIADLRRVEKELSQPANVNQPSLKSIAVLPYQNISADKENEYFSDGLTEEIIANLSKIQTLKVISRTSIMHYKGTNKPLKQIAKELQVQYVLEGSVRKYGNDLRITAQLIDASQDAHVWAEKYRGTMDDVFDIQEKVAGEIAGALKLQLTPGEHEELRKRYTEDTRAYQLYLKGRYYWNKRTIEGFNKAIEYFQQSVEADPNYALGYAGLADSYALQSGYSGIPAKDSFPKAEAAAMKALAIDHKLAEAQATIAIVKHDYHWDYEAAEREFRRAIELNPSYATAHHWFGGFLTFMGRFREGIAQIRQAQELDPLSLIINTEVGEALIFARQYDDAIEQLRKTLELDQNFIAAHIQLGFAYECKGKYDEAIAEFQKASSLSGDRTMICMIAHAHAVSGRRDKALEVLSELKQLSKQQDVSLYDMAILFASLGENNEALELLARAYDERSPRLIRLKVDPRMDSLRSDPRFRELLKKVGLE